MSTELTFDMIDEYLAYLKAHKVDYPEFNIQVATMTLGGLMDYFKAKGTAHFISMFIQELQRQLTADKEQA